MRVAVTDHAVDRFIDRVVGAKGFMRESVRQIIRKLVEDGFTEQQVRPHPLDKSRRVIPFKSGESILFLSLGPNTTSFKDAEVAVISVLFEHEVTEGKVGMNVKLEDVLNFENIKTVRQVPKFIVLMGIEEYKVSSEAELEALLQQRGAQMLSEESDADIDIYELRRKP